MKTILANLYAQTPAHRRRNCTMVFLLMAPFVLIGATTKLLNLHHALIWIALVPFAFGVAMVCYQFWSDGRDSQGDEGDDEQGLGDESPVPTCPSSRRFSRGAPAPRVGPR